MAAAANARSNEHDSTVFFIALSLAATRNVSEQGRPLRVPGDATGCDRAV
jgi:hypothetical protein